MSKTTAPGQPSPPEPGVNRISLPSPNDPVDPPAPSLTKVGPPYEIYEKMPMYPINNGGLADQWSASEKTRIIGELKRKKQEVGLTEEEEKMLQSKQEALHHLRSFPRPGGRPFSPDGETAVLPTLATSLPSTAGVSVNPWSATLDLAAEVSAMPRSEREKQSARWLNNAKGEQASVASFNAFTIHLMSIGATPSLLRRALKAAGEEVRHAELSYALAEAYAPEPIALRPTGFDMGEKGTLILSPGIEYVAHSTIREGCIDEMVSTLILAYEAGQENELSVVRAVLSELVRDEAEHAALAWDTVRWCLEDAPQTLIASDLAAELDRHLEARLAEGVPEEVAIISRALVSDLTEEVLMRRPGQRTWGSGVVGRAASAIKAAIQSSTESEY